MTQQQKILHLLADREWHPVTEFIEALRIYKYSSRIADIRDRMINIEAVRANHLRELGFKNIKYTEKNNLFYYRLVTNPNRIDFDKVELKPVPPDKNQIGLAL